MPKNLEIPTKTLTFAALFRRKVPFLMQYTFGYIISKKNYSDLPTDIMKVVRSEDECTLPLPKLVIGMHEAKEYAERHNIDFDILNREYPDGNYWTFGKTEKRDIYEKTLDIFTQHVIDDIIKNVKYYYVDVLRLRYSKMKSLIDILIRNKLGRDINHIIIDNDMVYAYIGNGNSIGISLRVMSYMGIDKEKVISKIRNGINNIVSYTSRNGIRNLKQWFNGNEYVIPTILTDYSV